ncbi:DUF1330 domain-containing protein [Oricola sp.]|uniref:DUF1330 domain-containing protein n=1 Tax=Oricola sp. TaxID=1979950 RepID=UPI003BACBEC4
MMSATMIIQVSVTNRDGFKQYLNKSKEIAARHGAELLFAGAPKQTLAGEGRPHDLAVVIRFPDTDAIEAWYSSEDYQAIVSLREQSSQQVMTVYAETPA